MSNKNHDIAFFFGGGEHPPDATEAFSAFTEVASVPTP